MTIAAPPWLKKAASYIGFHETGNNRGIEHFIALAHTGELGDPWCAIFANACLEECGFPGTRSASARSFEHHPNFTRLDGPAVGAVVTRWRGSQSSGTGHVYFYAGEQGSNNWALGGNQDDQVEIEAQPKAPTTGYWWPKGYALPTVSPLAIDKPTKSVIEGWAVAEGDSPVTTTPSIDRVIQQARLTQYAPGASGSSGIEGPFSTSRVNLECNFIPHTLDEVLAGASSYVSLASDPSNYGFAVHLGPQKWLGRDGNWHSLDDVWGYVHDTGGAFHGHPDYFDVATIDARGIQGDKAAARYANVTMFADVTLTKDLSVLRTKSPRRSPTTQPPTPTQSSPAMPSPTTSATPPSLSPEQVQVIADAIAGRLAKQGTPTMSALIGVAITALPHIGVWGLVLQQVLATVGTIGPALGPAATTTGSTLGTTLFGMVVSGVLSRIGSNDSTTEKSKLT